MSRLTTSDELRQQIAEAEEEATQCELRAAGITDPAKAAQRVTLREEAAVIREHVIAPLREQARAAEETQLVVASEAFADVVSAELPPLAAKLVADQDAAKDAISKLTQSTARYNDTIRSRAKEATDRQASPRVRVNHHAVARRQQAAQGGRVFGVGGDCLGAGAACRLTRSGRPGRRAACVQTCSSSIQSTIPTGGRYRHERSSMSYLAEDELGNLYLLADDLTTSVPVSADDAAVLTAAGVATVEISTALVRSIRTPAA